MNSTFHIPYSNPYSTKLLGEGLSILNNVDIDMIYGWYFEPYATVASVLGKISDKPVILKHAGSDLNRLSAHKQLNSAYSWAMNNALCVITNTFSPKCSELFDKLNVPQEKRLQLFPSRISKSFSHNVAPLDIDTLRSRFKLWVEDVDINEEIKAEIQKINEGVKSPAPSIGIYGKIGTVKGTFDLVSALESLIKEDENVPFNFVSVSTGALNDLEKFYGKILANEALVSRTSLLPPMSPTKIPSLLKYCDIICCLERKFPVEIHAPELAREVLAGGSCLVVSREIADKQACRDNLVNMKNCVIIEDPTNIAELSGKLKELLTNMEETKIIAKHGQYLSATIEDLLTEENAIGCVLVDLLEEYNVTTEG